MPLVTHLIAATGPRARERVTAELARWGHTTDDPGRAVAGGAEEVADAVRRAADLGSTSVVLQPTQDEPDLEGFVRFAGRDVRAALTG
jgi:alkanesulfonate monooxygenase SsuD/methylene tetrahydromethanopterin reductase-like flavin-dependent oxidoreductase (luciferase family)